jgi:CheY-like chemotaxis protein/glycine cleavage system H lipoate-binding protein
MMPEQVKVLVVDDEDIVLQSVRRVLKSDGEHKFIIDTALSAAEGIGLINQSKYHVVITDLMMPGIDGLEFMDGIRECDRKARIIMMTGYATMATALQALRKGAFDYIAKPFTKEELRSMVKSAARHEDIRKSCEKKRSARSASGEKQEEYHSFFHHTYARIMPDKKVFFGIEPTLFASFGKVLSVETSKIGDRLSQGIPFATITNADMKVFNLRAPLSGRVLKVNQQAIENTNLIQGDPLDKGWLIEIDPVNLEEEIENLGT